MKLYAHLTTPQRVFNHVARHLAEQGHRAISPLDVCSYYEAETGDRCAVGACMPIADAAEAESKFSGKTPNALFKGILSWGMIGLLVDLQPIHDNAVHGGRALRDELIGVATTYDLDDSILDTLDFSKWDKVAA